MTFCATINAVIHAGATPVLVDVEADSFNMDPEDVRRKITPRTRAIMPVHFAGRSCKMDEISAIAREHGLRMIEDCAHAIETEFHGRKAGTWGDCGVLSFYATKNIVTGEGGMVFTNDANIAARIKRLALHGLSQDAWNRFSDDGYKHYEVVEIGFKYNMMDLQAAIGLHQIARVDHYWQRRLKIWNQYNSAFAGLPVQIPAPFERQTRHALHLYTLLVGEGDESVTRDQLIVELHRRKIGTGVHYRAIPRHPVYRNRFGWTPADFPIADQIGQRTISLPLSAKLTEADVDDVIEAVTETVRN
jgi:dTDP-4-amino-4,6-dideoxygalactose transaminase